MSTALIITNTLINKKKLSQYLGKNPNLTLQFTQSTAQTVELAQTINPSLIIIYLTDADDTAIKLCRYLKHHQLTNHIPVLLIQIQSPDQPTQIGDACLKPTFTERELEQVVRQFTMGY